MSDILIIEDERDTAEPVKEALELKMEKRVWKCSIERNMNWCCWI